LIKRERRWSVICTNGIGIERHADGIFDASETLVMLVSLDGFSDQNDALRTPGAFEKTLGSIRRLVQAKTAGVFKGEISVATVISTSLVGKINEFANFVQSLGVNTLHLNFPWYISPDSARRMDEFYAREFSWLKALNLYMPSGSPSWHAYTFRLPEAVVGPLKEELVSLYSHPWSIRLKVQPLMSGGEMEAFIRGSEAAPRGYSHCVSIATRLSVLPNGGVTTCKLFPEFTVGNLNNDKFDAIWSGPIATRTREILSRGLTPVCSRCVQLYLNRAQSNLPEYSDA
jgi:radical SAM protein with 4Fe4S-binding SPASM domain